MVAAQTRLGVVVAGDTVVQRVTDRVEDARLACTGPAADQKDAVIGICVEVDGLLVFVRAETR